MKSFFEQMVDKTMEILAIDSVESESCESSPFGEGVANALQEVANTAEEMGFCVHNQDGYYVTCDIGEGETFGILGHLDVVPYENNWTTNPLGQIKDDKIFGRGILDDKGPMLCCLYACQELLQSGKKPTKKIRFIFGGNEESGWKCIEKYNELDVMPNVGFSPDGDFPVINCEKGLVHYELHFPMPDGLEKLDGGSRANIVMEHCTAELNKEITLPCYDEAVTVAVQKGKTVIVAHGKPAHASTPQQGDNALWHIINYLADALGGEYEELKRILCHNDGKSLGLDLQDEKSGKLTFNVGVVATQDFKSDKKNRFAAALTKSQKSLKITIDIRYPVTFDKEDIMATMRKTMKPTDIKYTHFHNPHYVDPNNELVTTLLSAYNSVTKENGQPLAIGGGTYARALKCGVAFGPIFEGQISTIHQKDECVSIDNYKKMYEIYKKAIELLCF